MKGLSDDNINPRGGCIEHTVELRCYNNTDGKAGDSGFEAVHNINIDTVLDGSSEATLQMIPAAAWKVSKTGYQDGDITVVDVTIVDAAGSHKVKSTERQILEATFHCEVSVNLVPEVGHDGFKEQAGVDCSRQFLEVPYGHLLVWNRIRASSWISASDFLYSVFLAFSMMFLYLRVRQVVQSNDLENIRAMDYAVLVRGFPKHTQEEDIIEHFSNLFDLSSEERNVKYGSILQRKKKRGPVKNLLVRKKLPVTDMQHQQLAPEHVKSKYAKKWVAEVEVVHPNGFVLSHYLKKSDLSHKLRLAKQTVKMQRRKSQSTEKAMDKVRHLQVELKHSEEKLYADRSAKELKELQTCIAAFVIFNHVESRNRCLEAYRSSTGWLGRKMQNQELQYKCQKTGTTFPLKVIQAPEPSDIQWENLDKSSKERILRKLVTLVITFLLLLVSMFFILWTQNIKREFEEKTPDASLCKNIPAVYYGDYEMAEALFDDSLSIVRIPDLDMQCTTLHGGDASFYLSFGDASTPVGFGTIADMPDHRDAFGTNATYYTPAQETVGKVTLHHALGFGSVMWVNETVFADSRYEHEQGRWDLEFKEWTALYPDSNPVRCDSPCVAPSSDALCRFPCFGGIVTGDDNTQCPHEYDGVNEIMVPKTYSHADLVGCYCKDRLALEIADSRGLLEWFDILANLPQEEEMCKDFVAAYSSSLGVIVGAAAMIATLNTVLKFVLKGLARFEGHASLSDEAASISTNLFVVQFINTALISYFVNLSYDGEGFGAVAEVLQLFGLFDGDYEGFPPEWYTGVGAALILTMILQIFIPHAGPALKYLFLRPVLKFVLKRTATTQRDLDKLMVGDPFPIDTRMPEVLNTFFVTMLYCGGIPILLPFAMCNFYLSYLLDKLWYLQLYGG